MNLRAIFAVSAVCVAGMVLATVVGQRAGEAMADDVQARLSVLWPNLMEMPQQDRALLALLAYECKLPTLPPGHSTTVACLRSATGSERILKARPDPAAHLGKLLDQARPNAVGAVEG